MVLVDLHSLHGKANLAKSIQRRAGFFLEEEWEAVGGHEAHRTYCFIVTGQRFHNETPCAACELHRVFVRNVAAW